jgi:hypothetical protein
MNEVQLIKEMDISNNSDLAVLMKESNEIIAIIVSSIKTVKQRH